MPFGLLQGLTNIHSANKANKELDKVWQQDPSYTANPLVNQQFDLAKQLFYGRMAGAPQEERNIFTNNANFNAQVGRNSSDGSQALALAAAGQGQTDQSFQNLQLKEQQNKYGMLSNLNNAYGSMINEGDKIYNDQVRRFGDYASIKGAQTKNNASKWTGIWNGLNSDFNDAMSIVGLASGMPGLGGGGKQTQQQTGGGMSGGWPGWSPQQRYNYP